MMLILGKGDFAKPSEGLICLLAAQRGGRRIVLAI